ncbi:hypothetical protein Mapa_002939 [Marchantia paleacea]|nr:hypothetical protein Mapa_002939 [Marchantia paleacea]
MRVSPTHWDSKPLPRFHVAGGIKTSQVAVLGPADSSIRTLSPPQSELQQKLIHACHFPEPGSISGNQRSIIYKRQEGGLQKLHDQKRTLHTQQRHSWETNRSFGNRMDLDLRAVHIFQKAEEPILAHRWHYGSQILDVGICEVKISCKANAFFQTCKHRVLSPKRILPVQQIEDGSVVLLPSFPVSVRHSHLVHICQKRGDQGICRRWYRTTFSSCRWFTSSSISKNPNRTSSFLCWITGTCRCHPGPQLAAKPLLQIQLYPQFNFSSDPIAALYRCL